jgi:hypothetical protein
MRLCSPLPLFNLNYLKSFFVSSSSGDLARLCRTRPHQRGQRRDGSLAFSPGSHARDESVARECGTIYLGLACGPDRGQQGGIVKQGIFSHVCCGYPGLWRGRIVAVRSTGALSLTRALGLAASSPPSRQTSEHHPDGRECCLRTGSPSPMPCHDQRQSHRAARTMDQA